MRNRILVLVAAILVVGVGCLSRNPSSKGSAASAAGSTVTAAELGKIGFAFAGYEDGFKKGPSAAADLKAFLTSSAVEREAWQQLNSGTIVFLWKATSKSMSAGPSNTVLAYARDVPTAGGLVLFGSGEVRTLSASDFAKASKASAAP